MACILVTALDQQVRYKALLNPCITKCRCFWKARNTAKMSRWKHFDFREGKKNQISILKTAGGRIPLWLSFHTADLLGKWQLDEIKLTRQTISTGVSCTTMLYYFFDYADILAVIYYTLRCPRNIRWLSQWVWFHTSQKTFTDVTTAPSLVPIT